MKRFIYLFSALISICVFILLFSIFSNREADWIAAPSEIISSKTNRQHVEMNLTTKGMNMDDVIQKLIHFADENDTFLLVSDKEQIANAYTINKYFVYSPESNFKMVLPTKNNKEINYNKLGGKYLTTSNTDHNSFDTIDFIDKNHNKDYNSITQFLQFNLLKNELVHKNSMYVYVYCSNKQVIENIVKSSKELSVFHPEMRHGDYDPPDDAEVIGWRQTLLIISVICFLICFLYLVFANKREIQIRKLSGNSIGQIFGRIFFKKIGASILVYIMIQVFLYLILVGNMRQVTYPFLYDLGKAFLFFVLSIAAIGFIVVYYIVQVNEINEIKKRQSTKKLISIAFLAKIAILFLALPYVLSLSSAWVYNVQSTAGYVLNYNELNNKLYIAYMAGNFADIDNIAKKVFTEFLNLGAKYISESEYGNEKVLSVNDQYLTDYTLKDENDKPIDIHKLKTGTLLLDVSKKGKDTNELDIIDHKDIVYVKHLPILKSKSIVDEKEYRNIPIIIQNEYANDGWNYPSLQLDNTKENATQLQQFLTKNKLTNKVAIGNSSEMYKIYWDMAIDQLRYATLSLLTIICIVYASLYLLVRLLLYLDNYEFAVHYLVGNSFSYTYVRILPFSIIPYVCAIMLLSFVQHNILVNVSLITGCFVIEMIYTILHIKRFEKKNLLLALKHFEE